VGLLGRGINPSQGRYLYTEQHERDASSGIRTTTPAFERAKTVYALDLAATMIGKYMSLADTNKALVKTVLDMQDQLFFL
jgi:hypothetical protein